MCHSFSRYRQKQIAFRDTIVAILAGILMLTGLPDSASTQVLLGDSALSDAMLQRQVEGLENDLQKQRGIVANANKICVPVRNWDGQSLDTNAVICYDKSVYVQGIIERTYDGRRPSQEELQFFIRNGLGFSNLYKQQIAQVYIPKLERELSAHKAELSRRGQNNWSSPNNTAGSGEIDYSNVDIFSSSGETATPTGDGLFDYNTVDIFSSSDDTPSGNSGTITGDISAVTEPWDAAPISMQECPYTNPDPSSYTHKIDSNGNPDDRTYLDCAYFKEGDLRTQIPYTDGKYDGIWLGYINWPRCGGVKLTSRQIYENGDRKKMQTFLCNSANGMPYLQTETDYFNGKQSLRVQWHSTGAVSQETQYDGRGNPMKSTGYNKQGELYSCTQWDSNGDPSRCK